MGKEHDLVDIVNERDVIVGQAERREVDLHNYRARAGRVVVLDKAWNILVQKRAQTKATHPNKWDAGVGETPLHGESYESAAKRGLEEELGILAGKVRFSTDFYFHLNDNVINRNYRVFVFPDYDPGVHGIIVPEEEEVAVARFVSPQELNELLEKEPFTPIGEVMAHIALLVRKYGPAAQTQDLAATAERLVAEYAAANAVRSIA